MILTVNKRYDFTTKYPLVLGSRYRNMRLTIGDMNSTAAVLYRDIITLHRSITEMAEDDDVIKQLSVHNLTWVLFEDIETKEKLLLAKEYIDGTSLSVTADTYTFRVENITDQDITVIKTLLLNHGYLAETI